MRPAGPQDLRALEAAANTRPAAPLKDLVMPYPPRVGCQVMTH